MSDGHSEYQSNLRMRHATRLVTEGSMRVGEVASAVDPASQPRLAKVFRTRFGASPLVCRRMKDRGCDPCPK